MSLEALADFSVLPARLLESIPQDRLERVLTVELQGHLCQHPVNSDNVDPADLRAQSGNRSRRARPATPPGKAQLANAAENELAQFHDLLLKRLTQDDIHSEEGKVLP